MLYRVNCDEFISIFCNSKNYKDKYSEKNLFELYNFLECSIEYSNETMIDTALIINNYSQLSVKDFIQKYRAIFEKYGINIPKDEADHREFLGTLCAEGYFHIINIDENGNVLYKNF